jgi:hypothetical protein
MTTRPTPCGGGGDAAGDRRGTAAGTHPPGARHGQLSR